MPVYEIDLWCATSKSSNFCSQELFFRAKKHAALTTEISCLFLTWAITSARLRRVACLRNSGARGAVSGTSTLKLLSPAPLPAPLPPSLLCNLLLGFASEEFAAREFDAPRKATFPKGLLVKGNAAAAAASRLPYNCCDRAPAQAVSASREAWSEAISRFRVGSKPPASSRKRFCKVAICLALSASSSCNAARAYCFAATSSAILCMEASLSASAATASSGEGC